MSGSEASALDTLIREIMAEFVMDGSCPPEIVPIPELDGEFEVLNLCLSKRTADFLQRIGAAKGISKEAAARSILNVVTSIVLSSPKGRDKE